MKETQNAKRKTQNKNVKCVILAAGSGTRMNTKLPKSLHKVGNRTMLERLVGSVKSAGVKDIIVVIGYGWRLVKDALKKYNIKTVKQKRLLGSANAVKITQGYFKKFSGSIMVLYTDTPLLEKDTLKGLIDTHINSGASCTLLTGIFKNPRGYGRILRDNLGNIIKIVEETDAADKEKEIKEINIGAYCFKKNDLFDALKNIKMNPNKKEFYLTDAIKYLKDKNMRIAGYDKCLEEEAMGINKREDLGVAEKIIRLRKIKELIQQGVSFLDPDTAYIDEEVKIGKDTVIYPSVVIEGEVKIGENCQVGPFAHIRGKTEIEKNASIGNFVEIVRSKIGQNTRVKHHAYLGDAQVGDDVNIGAGVITANYDGKNKNETIIKNKAFIGVGAVLIAPVKIGKKALVGAGSVVTKNKNVPDNTTVTGVPATIFKKKNLCTD